MPPLSFIDDTNTPAIPKPTARDFDARHYLRDGRAGRQTEASTPSARLAASRRRARARADARLGCDDACRRRFRLFAKASRRGFAGPGSIDANGLIRHISRYRERKIRYFITSR